MTKDISVRLIEEDIGKVNRQKISVRLVEKDENYDENIVFSQVAKMSPFLSKISSVQAISSLQSYLAEKTSRSIIFMEAINHLLQIVNPEGAMERRVEFHCSNLSEPVILIHFKRPYETQFFKNLHSESFILDYVEEQGIDQGVFCLYNYNDVHYRSLDDLHTFEDIIWQIHSVCCDEFIPDPINGGVIASIDLENVNFFTDGDLQYKFNYESNLVLSPIINEFERIKLLWKDIFL